MRIIDSPVQDGKLIQQYLDYLRLERRYSDHTVAAAGRDIAKLGENPLGLDSGSLKLKLAQLHAKGLKPTSLARSISSWRGFYRYVLSQGHIQSNPAQTLKSPKKPKRLPKALSIDQALGLLSRQELPQSLPQARGYLLIALLYGTGLRIHEAVGLDWNCCQTKGSVGWVDVGRKELQVEGKGGKVRIVPLPHKLISLLVSWRSAVELKAGRPVESVFVNGKATRISIRQAQRDVTGFAKAVGLEVLLHPHMLRHSFGSHMLQESQNLRAVQDLLGHESISSTQIYTSLDFKHLSGVYDNAFPRAKAPKSNT